MMMVYVEKLSLLLSQESERVFHSHIDGSKKS